MTDCRPRRIAFTRAAAPSAAARRPGGASMKLTAVSRRKFVAGSVAVIALGAAPRIGRAAQDGGDALIFWDSNNAGGLQEIVETLASEFGEQRGVPAPEHQGFETDQLVDQLQRAVQGDDAPDISQINNGETSMGP